MSRMTLQIEGKTHVVVTRRFAASPGSGISRTHRFGVDSTLAAWPGGLVYAGLPSAKPRLEGRFDMSGRTEKATDFI